MQEVIFYKSNGDELCRCELENDREVIYQRRRDFEEYLNKKVKRGELSQQVAKTYVSQTLAFLNDLYDEELIFCEKQNCQNLLFEISSIECLMQIYQAMNKSFSRCDDFYYQCNRKHGSGCPSACFKVYMSFLENDTITKNIEPKKEETLLQQIRGAYNNYMEKLQQYNGEDFETLESWVSEGKIKKLKTSNGYDFYVSKNSVSILPLTTGMRDTLSPFSSNILEKILSGNNDYDHGGYHNAIFEDILKSSNLKFSYYFVPTNRENLEYRFDAIESFSKEKRIDFPIPLKEMQVGEIAFIYVKHKQAICIKTRIVDINRSEKLFTLELMEFLKREITIDEMRSCGVSSVSFVDKHNFKIEILNSILLKQKREQGKEQGSTILSNQSGTLKAQPLNQILYGSPATGKTYNTIVRALEILGIDCRDKTREERKELFDSYRQNKRIEFITFHQSYGYEEFVEGIKPKTDEKGNVVYKVENGIFKELCKRAEENKDQPYILIIDEINRGNISKIFGELITLIEPSKRIGESEELEVILPYSQKPFGVPNNLYIIGTMNTADRSITSLDTALRRRFEFVEMMPKPSELTNLRVHKDNKDTGIELCDMLEKINKRIEFLYDREKTIGHAFFLSEDKENQGFITLEQLKGIFQNKIIPLLQEYFYNDYALIQAMLNDNGMIKGEEQKPNDLFSSQALINELDLEAKKMYSITSDENIWGKEQAYIKIYETSKSQNSDEGN